MTAPVHARLGVSQSSSWHWTLDEDLVFYAAAGVRRVGLTMRKLAGLRAAEIEALHARLDDLGIDVVSLLADSPVQLHRPERWAEQRDDLGRFMDAAVVLRPTVCVLTSGPSGPLPWETAADAFHQVMEGTIVEATREDLFLCLEPTNPLRTDVSFVHTVRDALDLGWRCDIGICLDLQWAWAERNLAGLLHANTVALGLVQISDGRFGARSTPDRLVPGDGDLPLARVLRTLVDAGYDGPYELELIGPALEAEGYEPAIARGLRRTSELLDAAESASGSTDGPGDEGRVAGGPVADGPRADGPRADGHEDPEPAAAGGDAQDPAPRSSDSY